jgi:hypothetical protein
VATEPARKGCHPFEGWRPLARMLASSQQAAAPYLNSKNQYDSIFFFHRNHLLNRLVAGTPTTAAIPLYFIPSTSHSHLLSTVNSCSTGGLGSGGVSWGLLQDDIIKTANNNFKTPKCFIGFIYKYITCFHSLQISNEQSQVWRPAPGGVIAAHMHLLQIFLLRIHKN